MRGEWNLRVGEACSCGALLFSERGNLEMAQEWQHGRDCVTYGEEDLESLLEYYLTHEDERRAIAEAGRAKARARTFDACWEEACRTIEERLDEMRLRVPLRPKLSGTRRLLARTWQALGTAHGGDTSLLWDLDRAISGGGEDAATLGVARGVAGILARASGDRDEDRLGESAKQFHRALGASPGHALAALGLVETLSGMGQGEMAADGAKRLLHRLAGGVESCDLEGPPFPPGYGFLRVEWERAAWTNAGRPDRELRDKVTLLRWRMNALLASSGGEIHHFHEAALARPDLPPSRAALGCALARAGHLDSAIGHLEYATLANPFDRAAARALFQALVDAEHTARAQDFRTRQLGLHLAAPAAVPPEPWFARPPATANPSASPLPEDALTIVWQGPFRERHSLALVNRALVGRLIDRGHELSLSPVATPGPMIAPGAQWEVFAGRLAKATSRVPDVEIRHAWPPDWTPPERGHWVVVQPWEYGSIPRDWVMPLRDLVDELWVPTAFVRNAFVRGGVPVQRVHVVPNGVDIDLFRPGVPALPLPTAKGVKFLFVGGTIHRKGIDILLEAYAEAFADRDDVCLVVKDMGGSSFYRGQTAGEMIRAFRQRLHAPEVVYLDEDLEDAEMAALYCACDCLVHPYRGEGFGLPIAEAMACGLPVVVTGHGAALDFCDEANAYLVPAREVGLPDRRVGHLETVGVPTLAEPDVHALAAILRRVVAEPGEALRRGEQGRQRIVGGFTWDHAATLVERRLRELRGRPIRRLSGPAGTVHGHATALHEPARDRWVGGPLAAGRLRADVPAIVFAEPPLPGVSLCAIVKNEEHNLPACLAGAKELFDEIVVVDTGSSDRTREVALALGARVFEFPWVDHFAAARNACLARASREWIFWMDADDRLDDENRDRLRRLFRELPPKNVAYSMKCVCDSADGSVTVVDHIRLFRNDPRIRWRYRIHEQILGAVRDAGGEVRWSDVSVRHTGYVDPSLKDRKRQRDLRLLEMERAEQPHDPFTLFNLGATYQEMGRHAEALPLLRESLSRSHPSDSIVRKLYSLISLAEMNLGRHERAVKTCRDGQAVCPDDAELLFLEGVLLTDTGDLQGAKAALVRLLGTESGPHFASVADGLRGHTGRHQLALVCVRLGENAEAESLWRGVLRERPGHAQAWLGLGELYLAQGRWPEFHEAAGELSRLPGGDPEATLLVARWHRARREFSRCRVVLAGARARWPDEVAVLVHLSHALLEEGHDHAGAEAVLEEILRRDPGNAQARSNLEALRRRIGNQDLAFQGDVGLGQLYQAACDTPSGVGTLLPALYELARESPHVAALGGCGGGVVEALLYARPDELVCYGTTSEAATDRLLALRGSTSMRFERDVPWEDLGPTDLLVIDARGDPELLTRFLSLHTEKAGRIAVVGTSWQADQGSEGASELIEGILRQGAFRLRKLADGAGLSILERR